MSSPATTTPTDPIETRTRRTSVAAAWGLGAVVLLVAVALVLPPALDWDTHLKPFPLLHAEWDPRLGPGTLPALLIAAIGGVAAVGWAERLPWRRLLAGSFGLGLAWLLSLAYVDGSDGIGRVLDGSHEYLRTARATTDVPATLAEYVDKIPLAMYPDNWPVHVAGHPPGALLFFVLLDRIGLGSGYAAGLVVTVLAATTALAVLVTLRALGAEAAARRAAPFLVLAPAAVWQAVSADALFAAVAAWGMACLALAATSAGRRSVGWAVLAGLLLGYVVLMSYGLPLLGVLALAVLLAARSWRPLPIAAVVAAGVVLVFAAYGFRYWEALPVLRERYWDGVAHLRPASYWVWADVAAFVVSAGPLCGAGLGAGLSRIRDGWQEARPVLALGLAGWLMVLIADASLMSKAEVERIWLPFVPWALVLVALLPRRWRRVGLIAHLVLALVVQHLLFTNW